MIYHFSIVQVQFFFLLIEFHCTFFLFIIRYYRILFIIIIVLLQGESGWIIGLG